MTADGRAVAYIGAGVVALVVVCVAWLDGHRLGYLIGKADGWADAEREARFAPSRAAFKAALAPVSFGALYRRRHVEPLSHADVQRILAPDCAPDDE